MLNLVGIDGSLQFSGKVQTLRKATAQLLLASLSALALVSQALKPLNTKITVLNNGRRQEVDLDTAALHLGSQGEV